MRIVGGAYRGRNLASPAAKDQRVRPTSDRLRETIFNILSHGQFDDPVPDARVLDLFAGTGALGFEALSRGAKFVLFVDDAAISRGLIRQNIDTFGAGGTTRLFKRDATKLGIAGKSGQFSMIFADPPYDQNLATKALIACRDGGWIADNATIMVEDSAAAKFVPPHGFVEQDRRKQGESEIIFMSLLEEA